jgi:hypothetical protein
MAEDKSNENRFSNDLSNNDKMAFNFQMLSDLI